MRDPGTTTGRVHEELYRSLELPVALVEPVGHPVVVGVALLDVRQNLVRPGTAGGPPGGGRLITRPRSGTRSAAIGTPKIPAVLVRATVVREFSEGVVVAVEGQGNLLQVVRGLHPGGGQTDLLDGGEEQADQHRDDRDDYQQLDQREALAETTHDAPPPKQSGKG